FYVSVNRDPEIQEARLKLPVCGEEQRIMEAITENPVVVICGETGSGKTTQVPQFLYEAGYGDPESDHPGMVGITQPRRVAAVSMAQRVGTELATTPGVVSHQIRYDSTTSPNTRVKFMTDGVLLRELAADFLLRRYSALIIDEAHERSLNTDILIGVLSRIVRLRQEMAKNGEDGVKELRVIIMSATLSVSDFTENKTLFSEPPPVLKVEARQFPVQVHFNRRTPRTDYVGEAFSKACKIHKRLPAGGILIFLSGQAEIQTLCRRLERRFPKVIAGEKRSERETNAEDNVEIEAEEVEWGDRKDELSPDADELKEDGVDDEREPEVDHALLTDSDEEGEDREMDEDDSAGPLHVLPLYSLLSTDRQMRVFDAVPEGARLCVVATNVAETSLTIPGITYVVDAGRVKEREYDTRSGVQTFSVRWTSKASADQRSGRAGRTGPGHCYRLYSSAVFNDHFQPFSSPEISRMPIDGVVLQMKAMGIDRVANFPFPTPPDRMALSKAERLLTYLGALKGEEGGEGGGKAWATHRITPLGTLMSKFPVSPRFAKMLISGQQGGCIPYVIAMVASLTVGNPFIRQDFVHPDDGEDEGQDGETAEEKAQREARRKAYHRAQMMHGKKAQGSDVLKVLNVIGAFECGGADETFCQENFVRYKAMLEIRKLRAQLSHIVQTHLPASAKAAIMDPGMAPPSTKQAELLRQVLLVGYIDQVAIRKSEVDTTKTTTSGRSKGFPYLTMWTGPGSMMEGSGGDTEGLVYIHPASLLHQQRESPAMVIYGELLRGEKRVWMETVTALDPSWIVSLAPAGLCTYGKPLDQPRPVYTDASRTEADVWVVPSFGPRSWPLPPIKVRQQRVGTRWVLSRTLEGNK
ncbi:P-loop containing nucleoside triphosphate hydrolase protein, partial [Piptocephalis cylindrospora]